MRAYCLIATLLSIAGSTAHAGPAMPVAPPEDAHGVPREVVDEIRKANFEQTFAGATDFDRAANHKQVVEQRNRIYASYRDIVGKFEPAWKEFAARKAVVDKAVVEADELVKAGKLDEARALLDGVITSVQLDADGHLPRAGKDRPFLEPRDAELPAVLARFKIAKEQHDWNVALALRSNVTVRHQIDQDQVAERLLWIAWDRQTELAGYNASDSTRWGSVEVAAARKAVEGGSTLANTLDLGMPSEPVSVEDHKLKKGDWVALQYIKHPKISDKEISYKEKVDWRVPKNCRPTNRIWYVDSAGYVHYFEDCQYDAHSMLVSLTAALKEPAPAWATSASSITLVGKMVTAGPNWKLTDAVVLDTRSRD